MVTGRRAFEGKSTAKVVASIMTTEPPPLTTLSPLAPAGLERAVKKCLAKDPDERWQNAGDLASELRWILESGSQSGVAAPVAARGRGKLLGWGSARCWRRPWEFWLAFSCGARPTQPVLRVALNLPPGSSLVQGLPAVLSPDGRMVVMSLVDADGKSRFWIRRLSSDTAQADGGNRGSNRARLVPGQSVCRRSLLPDGKLRKIAAAGGEHAEAVSGVAWVVYGGAWSREGSIVFSSGRLGFYQVPASGGTPVKVPIAEKDTGDYRWPNFLPDGKHILVTSNGASGGIFAISLTTGQVQLVLPDETGPAQYVEPGISLVPARRRLVGAAFRREQSAHDWKRPDDRGVGIRRHRLLRVRQRAAVVSTRIPGTTDLDGSGQARNFLRSVIPVICRRPISRRMAGMPP